VERLDLAGGQGRRRLVEHDQLRLAREGPEDLDLRRALGAAEKFSDNTIRNLTLLPCPLQDHIRSRDNFGRWLNHRVRQSLAFSPPQACVPSRAFCCGPL
jgi:hypothetical protein